MGGLDILSEASLAPSALVGSKLPNRTFFAFLAYKKRRYRHRDGMSYRVRFYRLADHSPLWVSDFNPKDPLKPTITVLVSQSYISIGWLA